jgi:hypothetical protein
LPHFDITWVGCPAADSGGDGDGDNQSDGKKQVGGFHLLNYWISLIADTNPLQDTLFNSLPLLLVQAALVNDSRTLFHDSPFVVHESGNRGQESGQSGIAATPFHPLASERRAVIPDS